VTIAVRITRDGQNRSTLTLGLSTNVAIRRLLRRLLSFEHVSVVFGMNVVCEPPVLNRTEHFDDAVPRLRCHPDLE
jgi:hypothetical protein